MHANATALRITPLFLKFTCSNAWFRPFYCWTLFTKWMPSSRAHKKQSHKPLSMPALERTFAALKLKIIIITQNFYDFNLNNVYNLCCGDNARSMNIFRNLQTWLSIATFPHAFVTRVCLWSGGNNKVNLNVEYVYESI